jgi:competence protein ComEC
MQSVRTSSQNKIFVSPGLLLIVLLFASGTCWAGTTAVSTGYLLCSLLLLLLLYIVHKRKPTGHKAVTCFLLGLLFLLLGLQHAGTRVGPPVAPGHIYNLIDTKQRVSLDGFLLKYPSVINSTSGPETRLLMQVKTVFRPDGHNRQSIKRFRSSGLVLLTLQGVLPEDMQPGDRFLVRADLVRPSTYSTPGTFNYIRFLADQSIYIKGLVQAPGDILKVHRTGPALPAAVLSYLRYLPERIRFQIAKALDKTLTQPARGLYKAILIGDRNDVPAAVLENFTGAGCIHILAISGMHMGLLALVTIGLITWILKRSSWLLLHAPVLKIAVSIALLPLLVYALIAGFNIPVLRALLMTSVFILAILFDRPGNLLNHILLAALLILLWKPGAIFTASFQLSFGAVIAIALIYPVLYRSLFQEENGDTFLNPSPGPAARPSVPYISRQLFRHLCKWLLTGIILTTAAMLGTFPLLLYHFNRISLVAPLANLLVEPLVCFWSLIMGLAASLCLPLLPGLAKILFVAGSYGLIAAAKICAFFAALPHASLWFPTPSPLEIIIIYLALLSSAAGLHLRGRQRRYSLVTALLLICSLLTVPAFTDGAKFPAGTAAVTFLDVGHGSASLLQLPGNKTILIDGGGAESDRFNIGARVIAPFLWKKKLSRLDAVVITHPHADHYNGLPFILTRFRPKVLWINGMPGLDKGYGELLDLAGQLGIETRTAAAGDILFQAGSMHLLCVFSGPGQAHQPDNFRQVALNNPNDLSLVLRLETESKSFLFPADISAGLAEALIRKGINLKADVLLAPHHGSPSSMSQAFIDSVAPDYIAISAGRNNPFNFPAESFYALQQRGMGILSTGRDGTITFNLDKEELKVSSYQVN